MLCSVRIYTTMIAMLKSFPFSLTKIILSENWSYPRSYFLVLLTLHFFHFSFLFCVSSCVFYLWSPHYLHSMSQLLHFDCFGNNHWIMVQWHLLLMSILTDKGSSLRSLYAIIFHFVKKSLYDSQVTPAIHVHTLLGK